MIFKTLITLCLLVFLTAPMALADKAVRDPARLWDAKSENVVRVTTARVMVADYDLIRADFPEIVKLSNGKIDQWLLRNTAFISKQQAAQQEVNSKIHTSGEERMAYRPREYRRAHVFVADTGGLIDAKGTGAVDPAGGSHDNGLATLGDMIREYAYEKLIKKIFVAVGKFDTVGSYAVIDYGFNVKHPDGSTSRAGTILRQAHARFHADVKVRRSRNQSEMLPQDLQLEIETVLRHFGITSAVTYDDQHLVNLQGSDNGAVIDFGSFLTYQKFANPVYYFYDKRGFPDGAIIGDPKLTESFLQPDPDIRIPFNVWGYSQTGKADSKYDNPYIWSHELAESIARGWAGRRDVETHIYKNLLGSAEPALRAAAVKWHTAPPAGSCRNVLVDE